jgi:hypothetical protein
MAENISSKSISMNQDENVDELSGGNGESVDAPPEAANEFGPSSVDNNKKENKQSIITASRIVSHTPHNSIIGSFHDHFTLLSFSLQYCSLSIFQHVKSSVRRFAFAIHY